MELIYILYIIIGVLTISNIFFIWRGTQLVRQIETIANDMDNLNELSVATLEKMLEEMREIDIRGSFESDDEVGVVFKELKDTIEKYKTNI
jgi:HKD family nuclease|tara:strand:+ start:131 stop:403 length:273 start_codon:yes stop_codon:yes gene_type:complete